MHHRGRGYTATQRLRQKVTRAPIRFDHFHWFRTGFFMARLVVTLLVVLVVIVGGLFALSGLAREKPPVRVEKVVPLANLQN